MTDYSSHPAPDLVVLFGPRACLSLVGIVTLVAGVWHVDRTWDEKGSQAYARAAASMMALSSSSKSKNKKEDATEQTAILQLHKDQVVIPQKDLDEAFVFPLGFLNGWSFFAISYLFPSNSGNFYIVNITTAGLVSLLASFALSIIASIPMGDAVKNRNVQKKKQLGMAFVVTWLVLTASTILSNGGHVFSIIGCSLGMISIIASMKILWKYRKMGDSWEVDGKPNPNPVVYNLGGPLFVFGWFLFWIGMAATTASDITDDVRLLLPIYFNVRTAVAMLAGCGMVPIVMMVDYAHDEGAEYVGFGTDGRFFGWWEKPYAFLISWTLFGFAALLPLGSTIITVRQWIAFVNCILQGYVAGILIQTALYEGDMARKTKWSIPFVLLFLALAINIGLDGGVALALALSGAILIVAGQKIVFGDRKRGDYFMEHHENNPNPIVYSYGEPLFMTGWILMSLAMSLQPM